jgi:hypothetical protein
VRLVEIRTADPDIHINNNKKNIYILQFCKKLTNKQWVDTMTHETVGFWNLESVYVLWLECFLENF